jgi:hypothetical protein
MNVKRQAISKTIAVIHVMTGGRLKACSRIFITGYA